MYAQIKDMYGNDTYLFLLTKFEEELYGVSGSGELSDYFSAE